MFLCGFDAESLDRLVPFIRPSFSEHGIFDKFSLLFSMRLHPQLITFWLRKCFVGSIISFPQSHLHFHKTQRFSFIPIRETTVNRPNLLPTRSRGFPIPIPHLLINKTSTVSRACFVLSTMLFAMLSQSLKPFCFAFSFQSTRPFRDETAVFPPNFIIANLASFVNRKIRAKF